MNNKVYSREYLRGVPEERKQQSIEQIINQFGLEVVNTAAAGKTSYMVDMNRTRQDNMSLAPPPPKFTDEELIAAIQKRYPDCKVNYEEKWVETGRNTRVRKTGIVIDWS
jgi:hypothetical protein